MGLKHKLVLVFLRTKRLSIVSALGIAFVLLNLTYQSYLFSIHHDALWYLHKAQASCVLLFLVNLYISYEYIHAIRTGGLTEAAEACPLGRLKLYGASLTALVGFAALQFAVMLLFPLIIAMAANAPAAIYPHILSVSLLNTLLPGLLACLAGFLLALHLNKLKAYASMALLVFLMIPASDVIPGIAYDAYRVNLWPAKASFSSILPPNLTWTLDYQYGVCSEYYRWNLTAFWIFALLLPAVWFTLCKTAKIRAGAAALCVLLAAVNLIAYSTGSSKIDLSLAPTSVFRADVAYYRHHEQREEPPQFSISAYEMKLQVDRRLHAQVTMQLAAPTAPAEYGFTLYNGYQLKGVTDETGSALAYEQNGDYITVWPEGPLQSVTMEYSGYSPVFYSNEQGVCLPGSFPYYPWAGYRKLYYATTDPAEGLAAFIARTDFPTADIRAEISGVKNLQTNLEQQDGFYCGRTNTLSVMGGFIEQKRLGPYNTVVCSLVRAEDQISKAFLDALQAEIRAVEEKEAIREHIDLTEYTIFQGDETLLGRSGYGLAVPLDNHIFLLTNGTLDHTARWIVQLIHEGPPMTREEKFRLEGRYDAGP